jgi:hypothetical protein
MSKTTTWILIGAAVLLVLLFLAQERQKQTSATVNNYGGAAGWLTGIANLLTAGGKVYGNATKGGGSGETSSYSPDIVYGTDSSIGGEN